MSNHPSPAAYEGSASGYINVSVANVYTEATFRSEICTQAVLWERVALGTTENGFIEVICEDGYPGWVDEHQVASPGPGTPGDLRMMTGMTGMITLGEGGVSRPVGRIWAGGYLDVVEESDSETVVRFPDGRRGSIDFELTGKTAPADRMSITGIARWFLGVPYQWGGKTPAASDCSGLVQLVHKLCGVSIRRDASDQYEEARHLSDDPLSAAPGDLLFFSGDSDRITHVGMSLGAGLVIHSRGMVRLDSTDPDDGRYRKPLIDSFVAVRTYLSDDTRV